MRSLLSKLDALRIEFGILLLSLLCTFLAKYHLLATFAEKGDVWANYFDKNKRLSKSLR